jgi:hypothetical protein
LPSSSMVRRSPTATAVRARAKSAAGFWRTTGSTPSSCSPISSSTTRRIFTYIWLLRNEKPAAHRKRVMLIDARKQFEKEPKSFGSKRNRMTDAHREWIEERYRNGWKVGFHDEQVKAVYEGGFRVPQGECGLLAVRRARPSPPSSRSVTRRPSPPRTSRRSRHSTTATSGFRSA